MNPQQWHVLIEELDPFVHWRMTRIYPATDFEQALALAEQAARYHRPVHPAWPRSRALYRTLDGGWLVYMAARKGGSHFRVSVAESYGVFPEGPKA